MAVVRPWPWPWPWPAVWPACLAGRGRVGRPGGRVAGWVARWPGGLVAVADVYIDGSDM